MPDLATADGWLPLAFAAIMGLAVLAYVILDGYDLGVGMLLLNAPGEERDAMVASIMPFWDANETWLVLGVGILLVAFPAAHGIVLTSLYLPVLLMLVGLILRGVAFDFRLKTAAAQRPRWNRLFATGSTMASLTQGYMLGSYITGFAQTPRAIGFSMLIALGLAAGYLLLGATWLILKSEGALQRRAIAWARVALAGTALGILAVSVATPLVSERVFHKWFALPQLVLLLPIPAATLGLLFIGARSLQRLPIRLAQDNEYGSWVPFGCAVALFLFAFYGLAYSLFPYLIIDRMTLWQAASATGSSQGCATAMRLTPSPSTYLPGGTPRASARSANSRKPCGAAKEIRSMPIGVCMGRVFAPGDRAKKKVR